MGIAIFSILQCLRITSACFWASAAKLLMKKRISVVVLFHNWRTLRTMTTAALTSNLDRSMAYQFTVYCLLITVH